MLHTVDIIFVRHLALPLCSARVESVVAILGAVFLEETSGQKDPGWKPHHSTIQTSMFLGHRVYTTTHVQK